MKKRMKITVEQSCKDQRLDAFVAEAASVTRSCAQRLCESGCVFCGVVPLKKNYRLAGGEMLEINISEAESADIKAVEMPIDIVYEDDDLLVVNKPKGLVVHPAAGHRDDTLVSGLLAHCGSSLSGIGGVQRPGIVHRIDKDTSGLLIIAKNDRAHLALSAQLADRSLSRTYDCVVHGRIEQAGTVDAPIGRSSRDRKKMAVRADGRRAVTHYTPISYENGFSHISCKLETGRTHQIRVHMASIGHPVAGDTLYGAKNDKTGLSGQCLHASKLRFIHPATGQPMELSCSLPEYFTLFLKKKGLS